MSADAKSKVEAADDSPMDDDIEMSNDDAVLRHDQDVSLPKSNLNSFA
jgi:hypothetical protein